MNPCFAIIDRNTLESIALKDILWELFNHVEIHSYDSMDKFIRDSNRHFVHFFVSSEIIFTCADEFETLKDQTTVISSGPNILYKEAGFNILDTSLPEIEVIQKISSLQATGRYGEAKTGKTDTKNVCFAFFDYFLLS